MIIENIRFTPKAFSLIEYADDIARENEFNVVHPVHLFLGALKMKCEVNNELRSIIPVDAVIIGDNLNLCILEKMTFQFILL